MNKSFFINGALLLSSIVITFGLLEISSRIFLSINFATPYDTPDFVLRQELSSKFKIPDRKIGFLPGPTWVGSDGLYGCQNGREYNGKSDDQRIRKVLILGDSVVQARYLEKAFKQILPEEEFHIYNAGIGAYNTIQEAYYLKDHISVSYDDLVLAFCLNDFTFSVIVASNGTQQQFKQCLFEPIGYVSPFLFEHSYLYRFVMLRLTTLSKKDSIWTKETVLRNKSIVRDGLKIMREQSRKRNAQMFVIIYPHLQNYVPDDYLSQAYLSIVELLKELKIPFIDLHKAFTVYGMERLKQQPNDYVHPIFEGHLLAAQEFIKVFGKDLGVNSEIINRLFENDSKGIHEDKSYSN